ncbi:MAG: PDZ domain-containing protein [Acetobacteraceae bacterium]|nr:PDZ domain-containing protein [Acetobacteraceae bacterium]
MKNLLFLAVLLATGIAYGQTSSGNLKRRADIGVTFVKSSNSPGATIQRIVEGSPAQKAGLLLTDKIIAINGVFIDDSYTLQKSVAKIRGGDIVRLTVVRQRSTDPINIQFTPLAAPFETHTQLLLEAIQLTNDYGDRLRAFVTKPKDVNSKLPAILFVSWLSCSTVELVQENDPWADMLRDVATKSGALMLRLEKPGVGDSEGIACSDCDLQREVNGYQAALRYLKNRKDIDTTRIFIFGASLGGSLGSIIGKGHSIRGYISAVTVYKSWLEHMIELERRRIAFSEGNQGATSLMQGYIEFHTDYLVGKKTPKQVIADKPHLAPLWYDDPEHQYGRSATFYHQTQNLNFMQSWAEVNVPVLLVAGEYDWIMSLEDSQLVADALNKKNPGQVTRIVAKGMNHHWAVYPSAKDAFDEVKGVYAKTVVEEMVAWIVKQYK